MNRVYYVHYVLLCFTVAVLHMQLRKNKNYNSIFCLKTGYCHILSYYNVHCHTLMIFRKIHMKSLHSLNSSMHL